MEQRHDEGFRLFVTDIDNTLFDWVSYYVAAFSALLHTVERVIGVPYATLAAESKTVFEVHGSIEYPFLIQELPSVIGHYGQDIDGMLQGAVKLGRDAFLAAGAAALVPYPRVVETLARLKEKRPKMPVVALTDAPRYVAMWKLNKLGLLDVFDAIYGLPDPRIPLASADGSGQGRVKVDPEILLKHLRQNNFGFKGKIRNLPDDYEKPGTRGLKTVLMDYELDEDPKLLHTVMWVGDNRKKDVGLGRRLGVRTAWAQYGLPKPKDLARLAEFSPAANIHKNAAVPDGSGEEYMPDWVLGEFSDLLRYI